MNSLPSLLCNLTTPLQNPICWASESPPPPACWCFLVSPASTRATSSSIPRASVFCSSPMRCHLRAAAPAKPNCLHLRLLLVDTSVSSHAPTYRLLFLACKLPHQPNPSPFHLLPPPTPKYIVGGDAIRTLVI